MTRRITVDVYEADATTHVGTLASDAQRRFLKDLSAEGTYSLEVKLGHADEALLTDGRIVRFAVDGTARWQGLVEPRDIVYADPQSREGGRVVKPSGRGLLAIFERAVVYPELGLGLISPDNRYFTAASFDYDDSGWGTATVFHTFDDDDDTLPWYSYPRGFPDDGAYWIGPSAGDVPPVGPGFYWVAKNFTIGTGLGGDYRFSMTADDGFEFYLDGDKMASERAAGLWGVTRQITQTLDEGTHRIAVRIENFDRPNPSTNGTAFILSCAMELAGGAALDDPIVHTDGTWSILEISIIEPGMTPGHILAILLAEEQAAGGLADLTWDFDETLDSNGDEWPDYIDVSFPVGMSYLEVIRHLVDEHACDVEMDATGLVLHAYISKGVDRGATPGAGLSTVSAVYGTNLGRLAFQKTPPGPNTTLSKTAEGRWAEYVRSSSVTAWGRRVTSFSLGSAPSSDAAERQITAFFDDHAEPVEAITDMQLEEVSAVPLEDFDVGDTISATSSDGSTADCRVHGISLSEDDAGNPIWKPDLVKS